MKTPFSRDNANFSARAHFAARRDIYPLFFGVDEKQLSFERTIIENGSVGNKRYDILDGEQGIDCIVEVSIDKFNAPLKFSFQERFRRANPKYVNHRDITITEWNSNSNQPSELYKIGAGLFIYGYYDLERDSFIEVIIANTVDMLLSLVKNEVEYITKPNHRTNQTFIALTFETLANKGIICGHYSHNNLVLPGVFNLALEHKNKICLSEFGISLNQETLILPPVSLAKVLSERVGFEVTPREIVQLFFT